MLKARPRRSYPKHGRLAIGVLLSLVFCGGHAGESSISAEYDACRKNAVSTLDIQQCIAMEFKKQDARLNRAYRELVASISGERARQLLEVQRAWIKFKEANCEFYLAAGGGSLAAMQAATCKLNATAARASEIEDMSKP